MPGRPTRPSSSASSAAGNARRRSIGRPCATISIETMRRFASTSPTACGPRGRGPPQLPGANPTDAELESWLATHRSLYETPRRYDYGTVAFAKTDRAAAAERDEYERSLKGGTDPRTLGRSIIGGNLTAEQLNERVGPALAAQIESLPIGRGQRVRERKRSAARPGERRRGWGAERRRAAQAPAGGLVVRRAQAGDRPGGAGDHRSLPRRGPAREARGEGDEPGAPRADLALRSRSVCRLRADARRRAQPPARFRLAVLERDRRRELSRPLAGQLPHRTRRSGNGGWSSPNPVGSKANASTVARRAWWGASRFRGSREPPRA